MRNSNRRRHTGSAIAEFGPAVFFIFIVVMFPFIDLLYLGVGYAAGWYCNHLVVREVACHDPTDASEMSGAISNATTAWSNSGLCSFIGGSSTANVTNIVKFLIVNNADDSIVSTLAYPPQAPKPTLTQSVGYCNVVTNVTIKPFVSLPWIGECQGINAPITFTFADQRPQEEKGAH